MKPFYRLVHTLCRIWFKLLYRNRVYGIENIPKGPALLASNHVSYYDPPLIGGSMPGEIHYLAKYTLFNKSILRTMIKHLNAWPISDASANIKTFKLVSKLIKEGKKVLIFPEGVRSPTAEILPLKAGIGLLVQQNKCPIVPIYVHGMFEIWPIHKRFPKLWGKTACVIGKPIYFQDYAEMDKKEAQQKIADDIYQEILDLKKWYQSNGITT